MDEATKKLMWNNLVTTGSSMKFLNAEKRIDNELKAVVPDGFEMKVDH